MTAVGPAAGALSLDSSSWLRGILNVCGDWLSNLNFVESVSVGLSCGGLRVAGSREKGLIEKVGRSSIRSASGDSFSMEEKWGR